MKEKLYILLKTLGIALFPPLLVWLPFFFRTESFWSVPIPKEGMQTIIANFDGPLYIVVAKSLYNLEYIGQNFSFPLPLEYYAAHFPLFPLLIRFFSVFAGYPWGMLFSTLLGSVVAIYFFQKLVEKNLGKDQVLWLTLIFSFFPARWLIVRSVGSPEPLFVGSIIASVYYFQNKKYVKSGLWGAIAQLIKAPGILLFIAFAGYIVFDNLKHLANSKHSIRKWLKSLDLKAYPVILIPLALLAVFAVYSVSFGNFFAYFNSGDNIHLFFPPFQIFNYSQPWVNTHWLEEIIFIYLFALFGLVRLIKQKRGVMAWFVGVFFFSVIFVSHRDILRYALPIVPFVLISFGKELNSKEAKLVFIFLIIPIYLLTLAFISNNAMPISHWEPFL